MEPAPTPDRLAERESIPPHQEQQGLPGGPAGRPGHGGEPEAGSPGGQGAVIPAPASTPRMSESTSGNVDLRMSGRATKTTSKPPAVGSERARHASFIRRRARLRTTAPPTRRPETKPARTCPSPGRTYSTIRLPGTRRPCRITRRTSAPRRSLESEPGARGPMATIRRSGLPLREGAMRRPVRDPWRAGGPGSGAPPGSASGCGTRGSSSAFDCSAGTCASLGPRIDSGGWAPCRNARRVYRPVAPIISGRGGRRRGFGVGSRGLGCGKRSSIPPVRVAHLRRPEAIIPRASHRGSSVPILPPGRPVKFPQLWKVIVDKCLFPCQSVVPDRGRP